MWVKDGEGNNIAQVEYNDNLIKYEERFESEGFSTGITTLGITKLKSGSYVLIELKADEEAECRSAKIVSDRAAFNAITDTGNDYMLDEPKYARLKVLAEIDGEDDGTGGTDVLTIETTVKKQGNSLVLIITDELRQMGLDVGEAVGVTLYKVQSEAQGQSKVQGGIK